MMNKLALTLDGHIFLYLPQDSPFEFLPIAYLCTCWKPNFVACSHGNFNMAAHKEVASFFFDWPRQTPLRELYKVLKLLKDEIIDDVKSNNGKLSNKMLFKLITTFMSYDFNAGVVEWQTR